MDEHDIQHEHRRDGADGRTRRRRGLAVLAAAGALAAVLAAGAVVAGAPAGAAARVVPAPRLSSSPYDPVVRLAGADRIATAVAVSEQRYPVWTEPDRQPRFAVLAGAEGFADALAGAPLAASGGPLLLTAAGGLDPRTAAELQRVLPAGRTVHLLGGPGALGPEVERQVAALGYAVQRLAGQDRYGTAAAIARHLVPASAVDCRFVVATGLDFPDAVVAAGWAQADQPLLLSAGDRMPPAAVEEAERCSATVPDGALEPAVALSYVGGPAQRAVQSIQDALEPGVYSPRSCTGRDRYATSVQLCLAHTPLPDEPRGTNAQAIAVVSGTSAADALVAATLVESTDPVTGAVTPVSVVLVPPGPLPPFLRGYFHGARGDIGRAWVVGGPAAVSDDVLTAVQLGIS